MNENTTEATASILRIFGDKTRLSMLKLLQLKDCCVCEFVDVFNMSQPAISQHVKRLKDADLVNERRSGQWIIYSLNEQAEYYPLLLDVLIHTPDQEERLIWLQQQGLVINCE